MTLAAIVSLAISVRADAVRAVHASSKAVAIAETASGPNAPSLMYGLIGTRCSLTLEGIHPKVDNSSASRTACQGAVGGSCGASAVTMLVIAGRPGRILRSDFALGGGLPSVMYITKRVRKVNFLCVRFRQMKGNAGADQLITFTRRLHEASPIEDGELSPAALYQARTFQLMGNICDGWPLHT
jgi:hypothetical protein